MVLLLAGLLAGGETRGQPPETSEPPSDQLAQLRADVEYLAGETLRGRGVDDAASIALAAEFIAERMSAIGLQTDWYDGKPFQKVPLMLQASAGAAERNRLLVSWDGSDKPLTAGLEAGLNPLAIGSLSGQVSGKLVFVGYGITAPNYDYDDYAGVNVDGAIVMILRKEPGANDPDSKFAGTRNTRHAFFATKIDNAIKQGASGVILVNDPASVQALIGESAERIEREQASRRQTQQQLQALPPGAVRVREQLTERLELIDAMIAELNREQGSAQQGVIGVAEAGQRPAGKDSVPVASISRPLADELLQTTAGRSLAAIEAEIDQQGRPRSFQLPGASAELQVELMPMMAETDNVIGVIPGRGSLASESVVIGAHYDHVGMGGPGSLAPGTIEVHNGADDNASGTAALLASAQQVRRRLAATANHRRIIYIAFTGEERGLVGSKHYVRAPRFPLESTVAMVNMDMVGRLRDNELTVYGTGSASLLEQILREANQQGKFELFPVATGFGPSDHQSFYEAGIPVLFFFTGLHPDYHRPSDDFDKINFGGLSRITDTVSDVMVRLATIQQRPQYVKTEGAARIRRQRTAFFGVTVADARDGVVLTSVVPGGPAEQAGLQVGDQIHSLGPQSIKRSIDVPEQVRQYSPGDQATVTVIRQGRELELAVEFGRRP